MHNSLLKYCEGFFEELEISEDLNNKTTHKKSFLHTIRNFLTAVPCTNNALEVYKSFSNAYWLVTEDDAIIRMIEEMKIFEQNAGILTEKQRDHFVHSTYVFILGLAIFYGNEHFRGYFESSYKEKSGYLDYYTTKNEEFLYRWGIASLFHDIAYPIEISNNQLQQYLNFISVKCDLEEQSLKASVFIKNVDIFNLLPKMNPNPSHLDEFFEKYQDFKEYEVNSLALIAKEIHKSFGIDFNAINDNMMGYVTKMNDIALLTTVTTAL